MAQQPNSTTNNLETKLVSLDTLRETTPTNSEFQQLIFANLPRGQEENLVQMVSYQLTNADRVQELKGLVLNNVTDGDNVTWTDRDKLTPQTDHDAKFDFDLYFRFVNSPGMENKMKLDKLLRKSTQLRPVISAKQTEDEFREIEITDKTHLWVELCTTPTMARYKLYQLFRAYEVLQPPQDENMVCLICLNGDWNATEPVADLLKKNGFVQNKAAQYRMDLAIAWTKHMNIYSSLFGIKDDVGSLKKDMQGMKNDMTKRLKHLDRDVQGMKTDIHEIKNDMTTRLEDLDTDVKGMKSDMQGVKTDINGMATRLEDLDAAVQEIKNALAPRPWGSFFKKWTLTRGQRGN